MTDLTFKAVTTANVARCDRWHRGGLDDWSVADWAVAMAGEAGEVCNAVKKLRRIEDELANISEPGRQLSTRAEAVAKIGEEIADTFLYLNLLACRLRIDMADEVEQKFNATSARYGFPERIETAEPDVDDFTRWADDVDGYDLDTGEMGIGIFARAVQVWSMQQERTTSVAEAARVFCVVPRRVVEAVDWHPWMFLAGPHDDYDRLTIEHEGE